MWRGTFVALICGALFGLLSIAKDDRGRFSLRLVFVGVTLIAILLGVIAADVRWAPK